MNATEFEHRATRILARAAFNAGALDPVDFEFLIDEPQRADEVLELDRWLAGSES